MSDADGLFAEPSAGPLRTGAAHSAASDDEIRQAVVGMANLAGEANVRSVVRDFEKNGPLARVLRRLLGGVTPERRGRKASDHLYGDLLIIAALEKDGLTGEALYNAAAEAAKQAGRPVDSTTMRRYHRQARKKLRQEGIGWLFGSRI